VLEIASETERVAVTLTLFDLHFCNT
jgi:hypothetical protein